ncbi:MAG: FAD-binding oxidoreductase [Candidatus Limivicinus sp.]|nr:FAD-binding oxidoreductase [Clostridiales bacterium]MCI7136384.1 FAD-binding oxidoreductase [Clostridiales bacterium]MDY6133144.1 FAD-binding oxidoreductase [Candidatus Limivicinus sp.]
MFNKVSADLIARLRAIVGEKQVLEGDAIGADYAHDELPGGAAHMPEAVVVANSTEAVAAVLKLCSEAGVAVTVRGAGTGRAGGSVPVNGGVVLSLKEMNNIVAFDENAGTLTVQPGVLLQDVKAEAEKHGLYYPPDPGEKTATIGGNASTNAGGPCAVKYGSTRDYVADAVVVLADGSISSLSENSALSAVLGSEGTLGVITQLTLKLIEKPACDVILFLPFMDAESCINAAIKLRESDFAPAILEYLDTDMVEFSGNVTGNPIFPIEMDGERVGATLMLTIEGANDDELDEKMEAVAELAEELECLDILVVDTPTLKRDTWDAHDAFHTSTETAKSEDELNVNVPAENMAELVAFAKAQGEEKGLKVLTYGHVGSGGLHIHVLSDSGKAEFAPEMAELAGAVYAKCAELGGSIDGEYGVGYAKKAYLKAALSEEQYAKLTAEKAAFDPKGILNPGKITV